MQKSCIFLVAYCLGIFTLAQASPIGTYERRNLNKAIKAIKDLPDDADKLTALQKNGVKASNYLLKFFNKSITEVENAMMVADEAMLQFRGQTDSLDLTKFKYTKQFIANHTRAKSYLLAARRDLVSLSTKQVHLCNNIEISINSWEDQHASFLIKNQFKQLKRLIQETKTKFESIHKNIDQIYTAFIKNTDEFEGQLKNAQENGTTEYNLWTNLVENSYNNNDDNSTVTIGEVIAALSKCSGEILF
jgi:gas vesicle protein